jgi:hypothetical protein
VSGLQVSQVAPHGWPDFIELSWKLHAGDPRWIPPSRAALLKDLAGSVVPSNGALRGFLCERDGEAIGRIVALVNPRLTDPTGAPLGQLGYFECVDDEEVATRLFQAGLAWLKARGVHQVLGPMNGGAHRLHRLLTRGFDREPFLFEPRNPPYYPRLFEANGFRRTHGWHTFDLPKEAVRPLGDGVSRLAERAHAFQIDLLDPRDSGPTLRRLHGLLDGVWTGHVGYASIDIAEFAEVFGPVLALVKRGHIGMLVDKAKGDAGCAFMYPDWGSQVRALDGKAEGWGSWVNTAQARRLVMHTVAVLPQARGTAAPYLLLQRGLQHFLDGAYDELVVALVTEDWRLFGRLDEPTREYALYGRSLA